MDFLKKLFEGNESGLTFDAFKEKAQAAGMNLVDLSGGGYVAKGKFDAKTGEQAEQIKMLREQLTARDTDLNGLKEQLTAAQTDAGKLKEAQDALTAAQNKYAEDKKAWEADAQKRAYEYAVKTAVSGVKFSSEAAKRDFTAQAIGAGLKLDGDTLMGFTDFLSKARETDPGAFAVETPPAPTNPAPPSIVTGTNSGNGTPANQQGFHFNFTGVRPHTDTTS